LISRTNWQRLSRPKQWRKGVSLEGLTRRPLEEVVKPREGQDLKSKKSGYGLLAKYGPGPSEGEIDENRREMFT
jgi:hypothetical protein